MKLIDKETLVAKIERLIERAKAERVLYPKTILAAKNYLLIEDYNNLLSFLNTLEAKEVDFITPEEIKKICTIYDNLNQERKCATVLYNSDETFFNHVLMEYKAIAQNIKEEVKKMEVKEVDFGTEVYKYMDEHFRVYDDGNQTLQNKDKHTLIGRVDAENIAKHFFELGLKVQKGE